MSHDAQPRGGLIILLTLIAALLLMLLPISATAAKLRPDLIMLVLIYWAMALPHRIGIFTAFVAGLLVDSATSSLIGEHALAYVLSIWIVLTYHKRLRVSVRWKQTLLAITLLFFSKFVAAIVLGITRGAIPDAIFWASPLTALFIWPWLFPSLRNLRRRFHIY